VVSAGDGSVDGSDGSWWQWDEDDLVALAVHTGDAMAVFLAHVSDVGAGGFEDPQAEQPQHDNEREVVRVRRLAGRVAHGFELQMREPECR
jgi:hypothetical protein